jgi:Protein of unknown function (DUF3102)
VTENIMILPDAVDGPLRGQLSQIDDHGFDYRALTPETAAMVRSTAAEIRASTHQQLREVIACGSALLRVKEELLHGLFGKWLLSEFGWERRTAQRYMSVAGAFGPDATRVSRLPLRLIYTLASQPPAIRDAIRIDGRSEGQISAEIKSAIKRRAKAKKKGGRKRKHHKGRTPEQFEEERLSRVRGEQAAAREAVDLICEHVPNERLGALIDLIDKSGLFRFEDALKARRP